MAKQKADIVIETVRYKPNGEMDWVRVYERRGPTFSDLIILSREELVKCLRDGQKVFAGKRIPFMASTFELSRPVILKQNSGSLVILTENTQANHDKLEDVPLI